jgi:outer membrane protein
MNRQLIIFFCFVCVHSLAAAQVKWDLKRCVEYAVANNISVQQADIEARRAELALRQSQLNQYPSLNLSANTGINAGRSIDPTTNQFTQQQLAFSGFNIQTGVTVFNWFSIRNLINANQFDTEAARASLQKIKNDISLNVAVAYLQVLVASEQVRIADVAVQQTLQNLSNTRKRVDAGVLPELNMAEVEAQLARDSSSLISAQALVLQNTLFLKAILNLDAAESFMVEMPPIDLIPVESLSELQPDIVYALALVNLPQQKVNELRIKAAQKYVEASKGQLYPSLTLFGSMASNYANNKRANYSFTPTGNFNPSGAVVQVGGNTYPVLSPEIKTNVNTFIAPFGTQISDNFRQNIGISLSVPLFNSGTARIGWQRNKLTVRNLELQKEQGERTLKQDVYKAYNDATTALQKFNASSKTVQTAEKAYSFAEKRYQLGLLSTVDFLTNQNNLTRAKLEKLLSQVDYVFRLKLLEFYKGQGLKL